MSMIQIAAIAGVVVLLALLLKMRHDRQKAGRADTPDGRTRRRGRRKKDQAPAPHEPMPLAAATSESAATATGMQPPPAPAEAPPDDLGPPAPGVTSTAAEPDFPPPPEAEERSAHAADDVVTDPGWPMPGDLDNPFGDGDAGAQDAMPAWDGPGGEDLDAATEWSSTPAEPEMSTDSPWPPPPVEVPPLGGTPAAGTDLETGGDESMAEAHAFGAHGAPAGDPASIVAAEFTVAATAMPDAAPPTLPEYDRDEDVELPPAPMGEAPPAFTGPEVFATPTAPVPPPVPERPLGPTAAAQVADEPPVFAVHADDGAEPAPGFPAPDFPAPEEFVDPAPPSAGTAPEQPVAPPPTAGHHDPGVFEMPSVDVAHEGHAAPAEAFAAPPPPGAPPIPEQPLAPMTMPELDEEPVAFRAAPAQAAEVPPAIAEQPLPPLVAPQVSDGPQVFRAPSEPAADVAASLAPVAPPAGGDGSSSAGAEPSSPAHEAAWWDEEPPSAPTADESRTGRFALGGFAQAESQDSIAAVAFRHPLPSAPTSWVLGPASRPSGTLVLEVQGVINCDPASVEVLMETGFAPSAEGFTVRARAAAPGPFMVSGTFRVE